jgi:hypothetical protein
MAMSSSESKNPMFFRDSSVFSESHDIVPLWKRCDHLHLQQRVQIKEGALKNAIKILKDLEASCKLCEQKLPEMVEWYNIISKIFYHLRTCNPPNLIDFIENVTLEQSGLQIYVGFLGATGAGKTSIVNATLGVEFERLLPSSSERASTAVVTQVLWNTDKNPE